MARGHGLAGVFLWEAGQDLPPSSKASLLSTLALERRRMLSSHGKGSNAGQRALERAARKARRASKRTTDAGSEEPVSKGEL